MTADPEFHAFDAATRVLPRHPSARVSTQYWTEATGAKVLIVDPFVDVDLITDEMATRGIHVTCVTSTVDALIEFGRLRPSAIVVAPESSGLPATEFVSKIREYGATFVVASLECAESLEAGPLLLAGAAAALTRPYTAATLWELLSTSAKGLDDHAKVEFGPIELDARAYIVRLHGERIHDLPLKEFEMLRALMYAAPDVLSNEDLRSALWADRQGGPTNNTISVYIARLRTRLEGSARIRRIRGRGYALTLGTDQPEPARAPTSVTPE